MQQPLARKIALGALIVSALMIFGAMVSDTRGHLASAMGMVFGGSLIALAVAENNPRE